MSIRDTNLSAQLQLDPEPALAKALTKVKMKETMKKQWFNSKPKTVSDNPDVVNTQGRWKAPLSNSKTKHRSRTKMMHRRLRNLTSKGSESHGASGKAPSHNWQQYPAIQAECRRCHKKRHWK